MKESEGNSAETLYIFHLITIITLIFDLHSP
jgi:hypothetical protein